MDNFELIAPNGTDINNDFLRAYRDSLKEQYDSNLSTLLQNKRNNDTAIMSNANRQGLMYSNFPQRAKIRNEADYLSNVGKLRSTYQTGLDSLRNNAIDSYNRIKSYEEAIADLNEKIAKNSNGSNGNTDGNNDGNPDDNDTVNSNGDDINGTIPTIPYVENADQYSDAGWSNKSWDQRVAEQNKTFEGKDDAYLYRDYWWLPDWYERGLYTGEWYFGNNKGKG